LVGDVKGGQPVYLVAEEIDPHRRASGGTKDVNDAASNRELTSMLNLRLPSIPKRHQ
jgi:hypothetical protein